MAKNIVEDIIVPEKRKSIRDIPIPENRRKIITSNNSARTTRTDSIVPPNPPVTNVRGGNGNFNSRSLRDRFSRSTWWGIGVAVVVLIIALLSAFGGGTLAYTPKSLLVTFDRDVYTATKEGENVLLYSVVKLTRDQSQVVPAEGEAQVERKASGTIVVYNNVSSAPQRLIANTRFEAVNGKIYRIKDAISIPGKKTVSGVSQPGSLEVVVYADEAGESFNQDLTDFTVPGLKGDARYKTIYARSKTPMTGGFIGMAKVIGDENLALAKTSLETVLKDGLLEEAKVQVPEDFVLIPSLSIVTYEDMPQTEAEDGSATINLRGNLNAIMFKKSDLSKHLASKKITLSPDEVVGIESFDPLTFTFFGTPPVDLLASSQITFEVVGEVDLLWRTDESALRADLLGKKKSDVTTILGNYPSIAKADTTIRPFWKRSFPDEITDITIKRLPIR